MRTMRITVRIKNIDATIEVAVGHVNDENPGTLSLSYADEEFSMDGTGDLNDEEAASFEQMLSEFIGFIEESVKDGDVAPLMTIIKRGAG